MRKDGSVVTPAQGTILPGITRATNIQLLRDRYNIDVEEALLVPEDLRDFQEAFFVGTAAEVTPIATITTEDETTYTFESWEETSLTKKIHTLYMRVVSGQEEQYIDWLY